MVPSSASEPPCIVILGDQLFPVSELEAFGSCRQVFMAESWDLCTQARYHKQKILLVLASMRHYRDELRAAGYQVHYHELTDVSPQPRFSTILANFLQMQSIPTIYHFETADRFFESIWDELDSLSKVKRVIRENPSFLTSRDLFRDYVRRHRQPKMQHFYQEQRRRLQVLMQSGKPVGDRWSFDTENRKKLPSQVVPPPLPQAEASAHVSSLKPWVTRSFSHHPGQLDTFIWPVTRGEARRWLNNFVQQRLENFGPYEDAMTQRSDLVFHSGLSPMLNLGLLTPREVLTSVLTAAEKQAIPLESLEGFIRQLIGWREFVYGIDQNFGAREQASNFFEHQRGLKASWYEGTTGIDPLDRCIHKAQRLGYVHHIERLMLLSNLMLLCEIRPQSVYQWFMEFFVDASEWVMVPNVFGMGQFADGGIFATKPYIAGSNYILKMSDSSKGPWCEIVDGLYWRFVDRHRSFFASQARMSMMVHLLKKIPAERYRRIRDCADLFLDQHTESRDGSLQD